MKEDFKSMLDVPAEMLIPPAIKKEKKIPAEAPVDEDAFEHNHQQVIHSKGSRVSRLTSKRKYKAYAEKKVPVDGKKVQVFWLCDPPNSPECSIKMKDKMTPREIKGAQRAQRMYKSDVTMYKYARAKYTKSHSRAKAKVSAMQRDEINESEE